MRVRRTAAQIVPCFQLVRAQIHWHICTHLHCYSLLQYRDKKVFQSHIHFTGGPKLTRNTSNFCPLLMKSAHGCDICHETAGFSTLHTDAHDRLMIPIQAPRYHLSQITCLFQTFSVQNGAFHRAAFRQGCARTATWRRATSVNHAVSLCSSHISRFARDSVGPWQQ